MHISPVFIAAECLGWLVLPIKMAALRLAPYWMSIGYGIFRYYHQSDRNDKFHIICLIGEFCNGSIENPVNNVWSSQIILVIPTSCTNVLFFSLSTRSHQYKYDESNRIRKTPIRRTRYMKHCNGRPSQHFNAFYMGIINAWQILNSYSN